MEKNEPTKGSAIDGLPEGHPVWLLMYASAALGALLMSGWFISQFLAWMAVGDVEDVVWTVESLAVGAALLFAPALLSMGLVQLVASRRRRRRNG